MANSKSAEKRVRVSTKKKLLNSSKRSSLRKLVKKAYSAIESDDKNKSTIALSTVKAIDQAVSNGIIHKNKGSRDKSKLVNALK